LSEAGEIVNQAIIFSSKYLTIHFSFVHLGLYAHVHNLHSIIKDSISTKFVSLAEMCSAVCISLNCRFIDIKDSQKITYNVAKLFIHEMGIFVLNLPNY